MCPVDQAYYKGYIPHEILIDKKGKVVWSQIGEVEFSVLKSRIAKLLAE